jgi:hypothetical protein
MVTMWPKEQAPSGIEFVADRKWVIYQGRKAPG